MQVKPFGTRQCGKFLWYIPPWALAGSRESGFSLTIDEELNVLDDHLRRLKVEFDIYFGGGAKKPPAELEWKVKSMFKKYSDNSRMAFAQRFRFNTLQQRYALLNALWQQKLTIKEEGYRRPQDAVLGIQGMRVEQQHEAEAGLAHHPTARPDKPFTVACADVERDDASVRALYEALSKARQQAGDQKTATLDAFKNFVRQKTEQIRREYNCQKVEYSVNLQDGQVKLTAKPKT
ncbi:MAG TPA: MXAN_5187 C-terminal domain-containing protein [Candidatus Angelobacter sp.]|nr:MXAN_5187 C-terminal domain-containing protein [Candidatus Angelobacter sp.]